MSSACYERPLPHLREASDEVTRSVNTVDQENVSATLTVAVPAERVFAVLADPTAHSAIDGTGWVTEAADRAPLTEVGQIFRVVGRTCITPTIRTVTTRWPGDQVQVLDPPCAIRLAAGCSRTDDEVTLEFGGWIWRRRPGVGRAVRDRGHAHLRLVGGAAVHPGGGLHFPPFDLDHLGEKLAAPPGRAGLDQDAGRLERHSDTARSSTSLSMASCEAGTGLPFRA